MDKPNMFSSKVKVKTASDSSSQEPIEIKNPFSEDRKPNTRLAQKYPPINKSDKNNQY